MILCFGTYANILMKCSLPGTKKRVMVSTLVGTIDPDNAYGDDSNSTSVSRLLNCSRDFPSIEIDFSMGPIRTVGGTLTNIIALAKNTDTSEIKNKFEPVIALLDEDKKAAVIGAIHHVIQNDETLESNHRSLFTKCMGDTAANIVKNHNVDIKSFLAGLFLYTVLTNENTAGKDSLPEIKENGFIERFSSYPVNFCSAKTDVEETETNYVIPNGLTSYMEALRNKYNRIPTILYKEALTPFNNYYVPNNIEWHKLIPGERFRYEIKIIQNVTITKLMEVSRYIVLSGTGGLGKSMMMRRLLISCIDNYKDQGLIPFFIPLKDYDTSFNTMIEYVYAAASPLWSELSVESLENILTNGKAIFLFDGLDEVHASMLSDFTKKMNAFQDRYANNAFVISSRPYSNFQSFNRSTVIYLRPFTKSQAIDLVKRYNYRSDAPRLQERFLTQLDNELYANHKGFSDNPLLLSIMMLTFEMDAEVPSVKYLFYQEAYTVLSRRHDAMKDGYSRKLATGWNANQFADYFAYFCAITYSDGKISFTLTEIEHYFRLLKKKYNIKDVTTDDFIYDLINNLCLMYQDGLSYSFIHRSFQEYFCAKYFNAQLDELLVHVIHLFDRDDRTKKVDTALEMLYDMKPKAVEKYMIIPYIKGLIEDCESKDGIWTFLDRLYDDYEMADGEAWADEDNCKPHSNLYEFILHLYNVELITPNPENYPRIEAFLQDTLVYREDTKEDDWKDNLPYDYEDEYGEPTVTGNLYVIDWHKARQKNSTLRYSTPFISAVEDPCNAFMKEYNAIKQLLKQLEEKYSASVEPTANLFDLME